MDKKYNGFNNGRDRSDGVGGREVNHGKQETMTKEQIIKRELNGEEIEFFGDNMGNLFDCMEIYKDQQLSAERERLEGLIKNEPVSFFLVNIMRSLPNDKWPDLINALNERCSLPTAERERAGKLVEALQKLAWHLDRLKQYDIVELIKQTLNDYDTATKEPGTH